MCQAECSHHAPKVVQANTDSDKVCRLHWSWNKEKEQKPMSDEGGYLLSEEEAKAFQWLFENKIVMVQWEQWYNLKTGVVTKGKVHYYLADGTEIYKDESNIHSRAIQK